MKVVGEGGESGVVRLGRYQKKVGDKGLDVQDHGYKYRVPEPVRRIREIRSQRTRYFTLTIIPMIKYPDIISDFLWYK